MQARTKDTEPVPLRHFHAPERQVSGPPTLLSPSQFSPEMKAFSNSRRQRSTFHCFLLLTTSDLDRQKGPSECGRRRRAGSPGSAPSHLMGTTGSLLAGLTAIIWDHSVLGGDTQKCLDLTRYRYMNQQGSGSVVLTLCYPHGL